MKKKRFFITMLLLSVSACNQGLLQSILNNNNLANINVQFCTTPSTEALEDIKFIFVVDRSGSNVTDYWEGPVPNNLKWGANAEMPGTDPNGIRRYGSILDFLNTVPANDPSIYYGLINFSNQIQAGATGSGSTEIKYPLTNNQFEFKNGIEYEEQVAHANSSGWTCYSCALSLLYTMVSGDVTNAQNTFLSGGPLVASDYVIFFITDGYPYVKAAPDGSLVSDSLTEIKANIQSVMALATSSPSYVHSIKMNFGVYYNNTGNSPAQAKALLHTMSGWANGPEAASQSVYSFNSPNINFNMFSIPNRFVARSLLSVYVRNRSTVWEGTSIVKDSDGDGLSDTDEISYGSNPYAYDSDGNGWSDYMEYLKYGSPCGSPTCNPNYARPLPNPNLAGIDTDNDEVNDAEEGLLGTDPQNPRTNGSIFADITSITSRVGFLAGTFSPTSKPGGDGITLQDKMLEFLPLMDINFIPGKIYPYQNNLTLVSSTSVQSCYNLSVTQVSYFKDIPNIVDAFIFEKTVDITSEITLRRSKKILLNTNTLNFSDADFSF